MIPTKGRIIRGLLRYMGGELMILYTSLSSLIYLGIYLGSMVITYFALALLLVFTSYLVTWDLVLRVLFNTLRVVIEAGSGGLMMGSSSMLRITLKSRIPLRVRASIRLLNPPHLETGVINAWINGSAQVEVKSRWSGIVNIPGVFVEVRDPLNLIRGSSVVKSRIRLRIEPINAEVIGGGVGVLGLPGSIEDRLGDLALITDYTIDKPASTIHWLTSARVGRLMSVIRGASGGIVRRVVMQYTEDMLKPTNGLRPIDEALSLLLQIRKLSGEVTLVLIHNDHAEYMRMPRDVLILERELRIRALKSKPTVPNEWMPWLSPEELVEVAYPQVEDSSLPLDLIIEGLSRGDIVIIRRRLCELIKCEGAYVVT